MGQTVVIVLQHLYSESILWAMTRAFRFLTPHTPLPELQETLMSSGSTKRMHFTMISRQDGKLCAGIVIVLMPRVCSVPLQSVSVRMMPSAVRL